MKKDLDTEWSEITVVLGKESPERTTTYQKSIERVYITDTDKVRMAYNDGEQ